MTEYIEREALPQKKERGFFLDDDFNAGWNACLNKISAIPAADVRPVVRGKWEYEWKPMLGETLPFKCSVCGKWARTSYDYCPYCGADMREES